MFGCDSHLSRKRFVVRDESLRVALAAAAPTPQHQWMWMRGDEVRLSPPDDDDARAGPFGQAGSSANASLPKRQRLVAGLDSLAASSAGKRRASGQQDSHAGAAAAKHPRSSSAGVAIKMETQTAEGLPEQEGEDEQIRSLAAYLESRGGTRDMVDGWRANTETRREGRFAGYSDRYFFDPSGKRFRSHPEVARHFKLEAAPHIRRRTCLPSSAAPTTAADTLASTSTGPATKPKAKPVPRAAAAPTPRLDEQLWAQCDSCAKWRRLPESMRDSDELDEAWTCAMHPDPARRGCEVVEEGLGEDEVTTQVEMEQEGTVQSEAAAASHDHAGTACVLLGMSSASGSGAKPFASNGHSKGPAIQVAALPRKEWSSIEDDLIRQGVQRLGCKWRAIAAQLPGRSDDAVRNRWRRLQELMRGPEQQPLKPNGAASFAVPRTGGRFVQLGLEVGEGGSVRAELLMPEKKERTSWTRAEDDIIVQSVAELGHKWAKICRRLPAR